MVLPQMNQIVDNLGMDKVGKSRKKINIRGRPSLQESEVIKKDIRGYFDSGYSAYFCISETGYAKDTVYTLKNGLKR